MQIKGRSPVCRQEFHFAIKEIWPLSRPTGRESVHLCLRVAKEEQCELTKGLYSHQLCDLGQGVWIYTWGWRLESKINHMGNQSNNYAHVMERQYEQQGLSELPWLAIFHTYCHTSLPESNASTRSILRKLRIWNTPGLYSWDLFLWPVLIPAINHNCEHNSF